MADTTTDSAPLKNIINSDAAAERAAAREPIVAPARVFVATKAYAAVRETLDALKAGTPDTDPLYSAIRAAIVGLDGITLHSA